MRQPSSDPVRQAKVSRRLHLAALRLLGLQANIAKRVLCDEHGELTPDAAKLLALLAREARLTRHGFEENAERARFDAGAQHMIRLLIDWTGADSSKLARLQQQLQDDLKG